MSDESSTHRVSGDLFVLNNGRDVNNLRVEGRVRERENNEWNIFEERLRLQEQSEILVL